jgi:hypothetical protein
MDKRIKLRSYKATSALTYILVGKGSTEDESERVILL